MNYGIQNEYDFVELFNNKYLNELNRNSVEFLKELYNNEIDSDEKLIAWKNKMVQKADIFIKYKNIVKRISLKCGKDNSVHHEQIQEFEQFLKKLGISYNDINKYKSYHFGYKKDDKGNIDFSKSAEEIERLIRGLNPWPSAYTSYSGKTLKIWKAEVMDKDYDGSYGQIVDKTKKAIIIKTGQGALAITELQLEGKKRMTTEAFLCGAGFDLGEILGQ